MRNLSVAGFLAVSVVACSGSAASVVEGDPNARPIQTGPSVAKQGDDLVKYQKGCPTAPALPGILASSLLSFSVHYPSTWNNMTTQPDMPHLGNYSTVALPKLEELGDVHVN